MENDGLRSVFGTLSRVENFLESNADLAESEDEVTEIEMLLCEVDEALMWTGEEIIMRRAEEMALEAGSNDVVAFVALAQSEFEDIYD